MQVLRKRWSRSTPWHMLQAPGRCKSCHSVGELSRAQLSRKGNLFELHAALALPLPELLAIESYLLERAVEAMMLPAVCGSSLCHWNTFAPVARLQVSMLPGAGALGQDEPVTLKDPRQMAGNPRLSRSGHLQELRRQLQHLADPAAIAQWWNQVLMLKYVPKAGSNQSRFHVEIAFGRSLRRADHCMRLRRSFWDLCGSADTSGTALPWRIIRYARVQWTAWHSSTAHCLAKLVQPRSQD